MDKSEQKLVSEFQFSQEGKKQQIRVFAGDLTESPVDYDVVVCSAFKDDYMPIEDTLIGSLYHKRGISVEALSEEPAIDMRKDGGWLSSELQGSIRRVACIELLGMNGCYIPEKEDDIVPLLKSAFLALRQLLEKAEEQGISIRRIAMPTLGTGNQGIDMEYMAVPLFSQCMKMFKTIDGLETIDFYSRKPERAEKLAGILKSMVSEKAPDMPTVFISYSSKQMERAHALRDSLVSEGFSVWIAPEGIPAGSNYLNEIPCAISNARAVVLMLTEESMASPWVQREASSAIGAGKEMIPAQLKSFGLNMIFKFLLDGVQILPVWDLDEKEQDAQIVARVREKLIPGQG